MLIPGLETCFLEVSAHVTLKVATKILEVKKSQHLAFVRVAYGWGVSKQFRLNNIRPKKSLKFTRFYCLLTPLQQQKTCKYQPHRRSFQSQPISTCIICILLMLLLSYMLLKLFQHPQPKNPKLFQNCFNTFNSKISNCSKNPYINQIVSIPVYIVSSSLI